MLEWWWRFSGRGKRWRAGSQRCLVAGAGEWELWESTIGREGNHLLGGGMAGATRTGELGTGNWERIDVPPSWEGGTTQATKSHLSFDVAFGGKDRRPGAPYTPSNLANGVDHLVLQR